MGPQDVRMREDFWAGRLTIEYMAEQYRLTRYAMDHALGVAGPQPAQFR